MQVVTHHSPERPAFLPINRRFGRFDLMTRSRLHFYEAENIMVPSDQVNLTVMPRRAVVPRHHDVTLLSQIEIGVFLATPPDLVPQRIPVACAVRGKVIQES